MTVKELAEWLLAFKDQDATVLVVEHSSGTGYYDQGGTATTVNFAPSQHAEYIDFRGNKFVAAGSPHENARTLLLGEIWK